MPIRSFAALRRLFLLALGLLFACGAAARSESALGVVPDVDAWIAAHFARGKTPPFSFTYGGTPSSEFITSWTFSSRKLHALEPGADRQRFTWQDPATGLKIECDVTAFRDFGGVDWVMRLTNTGAENTPVLDKFMALDQTFLKSGQGDFSLIHALGSCGSRADFMVSQTPLPPGSSFHMAPQGGRSSDGTAFPVFNLLSPDERSGVMIAVGWTGGWQADFSLPDGRNVNVRSGMERFRLYLQPGETIRTPKMSLMFWTGDNLMTGQNKWRRFQLAHYSRKVDGEFAKYPYASFIYMKGPDPCTEGGCLTEDMAVALIRRHAQFGITPGISWMDAGWYTDAGAPNYDWCDVVGSWTPDPARYPNGLKPVADEVHRQGSKYLLWFEPERVSRFSWLAVNHPEWLLHSKVRNSALLDLGNPAALDWLCGHVGDMIEEIGVDIYRQDFNHPGKPFWVDNDAPDRVGMLEIRHIEGLYTFWDYLRDRFPRLLFDNVAAGGRRIDIEMMSRSIPMWRTDYPHLEVTGKQSHCYGLSFFLPQHGNALTETDDYSFRSSLSSNVLAIWDLYTGRQDFREIQKSIAKFNKYQPYFYEDYYPLTGIFDTTGDDIWLAYQLHRPADDSGVVVAFRRTGADPDRLSVELQGVDPARTYELYDDNTEETRRVSGAELRDLTLTVAERPGSILLEYRPASADK